MQANQVCSVYRDQRQLQDAMDSYKRCLTLKPDYAAAYNGVAFKKCWKNWENWR